MADAPRVDAATALCRNSGLITSREQERLNQSSVAVVGVGGDGGLVAERLVRLGVGHVRLVDPGFFDVENLNRQYGCAVSTIGMSKAEAVASTLRDIAPWARIESIAEGINVDNAHEVLDSFDLIIDEAEFSLPAVSALIYSEARRQNAPVISGVNIGFGANIFAFDPTGVSFEDYLGVQDLNAPEAVEAAVRAWCPRVPPYVDFELVRRISAGEADVPAVSHSVAAVASGVVQEAFNYLTQRQSLVWVPRYIEIDLARRSIKVRRASRAAFVLSALRSKFGSRRR